MAISRNNFICITSSRISLIVLSNHSIKLPDSSGDAYWFEIQAYEWSQLGFPDVCIHLVDMIQLFEQMLLWQNLIVLFLVSYLIAILYALTERSVMLGQSLSLLFGTLSVLMSWILAQKIWDNRTAIKVGWFVALFPH